MVCGSVAQPGVMFVGVFGRRRHQLDHRAQRAFRAQDRPLCARSGVRRLLVDRGEIALEDLRHLVHVAMVIVDEHRAFQQMRWRSISKSPICRRPKRCRACGTACRAARAATNRQPFRRFVSPAGFGTRSEEHTWRRRAASVAHRRSPCCHVHGPVPDLKVGILRNIENVGESACPPRSLPA